MRHKQFIDLGYFICNHLIISPNKLFASLVGLEIIREKLEVCIKQIKIRISRSRQRAAKPGAKKQRKE